MLLKKYLISLYPKAIKTSKMLSANLNINKTKLFILKNNTKIDSVPTKVESKILFNLAFLLSIIDIVISIKKSMIKFRIKIKSMYTFIQITC